MIIVLLLHENTTIFLFYLYYTLIFFFFLQLYKEYTLVLETIENRKIFTLILYIILLLCY